MARQRAVVGGRWLVVSVLLVCGCISLSFVRKENVNSLGETQFEPASLGPLGKSAPDGGGVSGGVSGFPEYVAGITADLEKADGQEGNYRDVDTTRVVFRPNAQIPEVGVEFQSSLRTPSTIRKGAAIDLAMDAYVEPVRSGKTLPGYPIVEPHSPFSRNFHGARKRVIVQRGIDAESGIARAEGRSRLTVGFRSRVGLPESI